VGAEVFNLRLNAVKNRITRVGAGNHIRETFKGLSVLNIPNLQGIENLEGLKQKTIFPLSLIFEPLQETVLFFKERFLNYIIIWLY